MILATRLRKFLKKYEEFGFSGEQFNPPYTKSENNVDVIRIAYKGRDDFAFYWDISWVGNAFAGRIHFSPYKSYAYDMKDLKYDKEESFENFAIEKFENWLERLKDELEAEEENQFIINPIFYAFTEEELEKPFSNFQKQLFSKSLNHLIEDYQKSNVEEETKQKLIDFIEVSKEELENLNNKTTKKSFFKKIIKGIMIIGGIIGAGILENASYDLLKAWLSPEEPKSIIINNIHNSFPYINQQYLIQINSEVIKDYSIEYITNNYNEIMNFNENAFNLNSSVEPKKLEEGE